MSHMGASAVKLNGRVNLGLLEYAMSIAASEVLGENIQVTRDYTVRAMDNSERKCLFGFDRPGKLNYGIGIAIENNQVKFFGDSYGVREIYEKITLKTQQQYTLLALAKFAKDHNIKISKATEVPGNLDALMVALDS